MKSVKGKLVAGVVTVGLVSGLGVAAASVDIKEKLQTWYDGQFGAAQTSMIADATEHVEGKVAGVKEDYNNGKTVAANQINTQKDNSISGAETAIDSAKDQYITDLKERRGAIKGQIETQFDGLFTQAQGLINQAGADVLEYATNDFTTFTGKKGEAALGEVENDINAAKDSAVSELQTAIQEAKNELQAKLDSEEAATTEEIKDEIDAKINELRGQMAIVVTGLINAQKTLITDKANELQDDAIAALDIAAGAATNWTNE